MLARTPALRSAAAMRVARASPEATGVAHRCFSMKPPSSSSGSDYVEYFKLKASEMLSRLRLYSLEQLSAGLSIEEKERLYGARKAAGPDKLGEIRDTMDSEVHQRVLEGIQQSEEPDAHDSSVKAAPLEEPDKDPFLGTCIGELGPKKLYLMDIPSLKSIPVWERQRVYRKERAVKIAADKLSKLKSSGQPISFPGVITIYAKGWVPPLSPEQIAGDKAALAAARDRYGILDGQHRVGAMRQLHRQGHFDETVLVEVYELANEELVSELFTDINKAEPVKDVDLPGSVNEVEREILNSAVSALAGQFPAFFKESTKPRKPNVNFDNLRDAIFRSHLISRHGVRTDQQLLELLLQKNDELSRRPDSDWLTYNKSKGFPTALNKCRTQGFYLGLEEDWLET
uniref:Uncharacterized protein n=1 Tax=Rhizochromulina marina TaxID=1034831 RepID=A0A7S2WKL6_9STRA|mmetsp:Transcript_26361/g.76860  ORF Transcript_26361/g.76860 Transcript_26361/m.76860 type:complete len:400 (+) Transcript_26361:31-1230(+)